MENNDTDVIKDKIKKSRKASKIKRNSKRIIAAAIILVIGLTAYFSRGWWSQKLQKPDEVKPAIVNDGVLADGKYPIDISQSKVGDISILKDKLACAKATELDIYNSDGSIAEDLSHKLSSPVIYSSDDRVLLIDTEGTQFSVYNDKRELYTIDTKNSILTAAIGNDNKIAVITTDSSKKSQLTVYDINGNEIYTWKSRYRIIDVTFNAECDKVLCSEFFAKDGKFCSDIVELCLDKNEINFQSKEVECLILQSEYAENGDIISVGDSKFCRFSSVGILLGSDDFEQKIVNFSLDSKSLVVALEGVNKNDSTLKFYFADETKEPINIVTGCGEIKKIIQRDGKIYILGSSQVNAYSYSGALVAYADILSEYIDFEYSDNTIYLLGYRQIDKIKFNN